MPEELKCSGCGHVHCDLHVLPDGRHSVTVPTEMFLRAVDAERSIFDVVCPDCGRVDRGVVACDARQAAARVAVDRHPRRRRGAGGGTSRWRGIDAGGSAAHRGRK